MGAGVAEGGGGDAAGVDGQVGVGGCVEADEGEDVVGYVIASDWSLAGKTKERNKKIRKQ